jgi:hypothetical protein
MSFFENLSKIADTIIGVNNFVEGIKASTNSKNVSNKVVNSVTKTALPEKPVDPETSSTTITLDPSIENVIPVCYGTGISKGTVVDAALDADGQSIWISYVLSEVTGNLIDDTPSEITFNRIFIDGYEAQFDTDGVTVVSKRDTAGNIDSSINGLIKVYCYNDGSANQTFPFGTFGTAQNASSIFPGWNSTKKYYKMVFAVVKITFSQEKDLTYLPEFSFELVNTMTDPGDVLFDYLSNKRYGAGIDEEEINK